MFTFNVSILAFDTVIDGMVLMPDGKDLQEIKLQRVQCISLYTVFHYYSAGCQILVIKGH